MLIQRTMELGRELVRRKASRTLFLRPRDGNENIILALGRMIPLTGLGDIQKRKGWRERQPFE